MANVPPYGPGCHRLLDRIEPDAAGVGVLMPVKSAMVCFRTSGREFEDEPWESVSGATLATASPWRTFRWYDGQKHYSGTYWSSTMRDHVIYESRLELARLLFDDFDPSVRRILAQPFLLKAEVEGKVRKHIPDYLLISEDGPVVVDVKPRHRVAKPEVAFTFDWTRRLLETRGWRYVVWSEPASAELENLRFLAGYRRDWLFDGLLLDELRAMGLDRRTLGELDDALAGREPEEVRAGVLHLLWRGELVTDLSTPLSGHHVLKVPK
ncbi:MULTISPECIES: TnsA-like heteromeric transposase endonuclease subunit [unclassified Streptomyces]|uniref:TnsA-like heteromeric transposase endonuclease subunit n=1 Tax=unclassified Streptomyces TaxID=2593676 RepID=UPI0029B17162|nr:TnsA-like heteromeric transposase endonuclease subunit [Streptomyces sp. AK02-01A]MDX3852952.1 TnsA-like heteromeric transposase endonuclease subunit [Streptomyces sp. AK02-01A]